MRFVPVSEVGTEATDSWMGGLETRLGLRFPSDRFGVLRFLIVGKNLDSVMLSGTGVPLLETADSLMHSLQSLGLSGGTEAVVQFLKFLDQTLGR